MKNNRENKEKSVSYLKSHSTGGDYPNCGKIYGECNKDVFAYALCDYSWTDCPGLCSSMSCEGEIGEDDLSKMVGIGTEGIKIPRSYFAKNMGFYVSGSRVRTPDGNTYFETVYTFKFVPFMVSLSRSSLLPSNRSGLSRSDDPTKALYDSNDTDNYAELSIINPLLNVRLLGMELRGKRVIDSGGHIGHYHTQTEEDGQRSHWGTFEKDIIDTPKEVAGSDMFVIESFKGIYYPPEAGGKVLIGYTPSVLFSQMRSDGIISENDENYFRRNLIGGIIVPVKVEGLVELTEDPGNYILVGSTLSHPSNHYGVPEFVSVIRDLAKKYKELYGGRLRINDISLIYGGIFDINGDWRPPHKEHRDGRSVDISKRSYEGGTVTYDEIRRCLREIKRDSDIKILDEVDHFHLTFLQ